MRRSRYFRLTDLNSLRSLHFYHHCRAARITRILKTGHSTSPQIDKTQLMIVRLVNARPFLIQSEFNMALSTMLTASSGLITYDIWLLITVVMLLKELLASLTSGPFHITSGPGPATYLYLT